MSNRSTQPEVVLDCRKLHHQQHAPKPCAGEHSLLTSLAEAGYSPRNRMVGWSCVLVALGTCFLAGGGAMLVLSLTLETRQVSLTGYYNINSKAQGIAIIVMACVFFAVAFIKKHKHGHV
ncbi:uncharacterized protein LOC144128622 [Amblyomma americanum]